MRTANGGTTTPAAASWLSRRRDFVLAVAAAASAIALALSQHWLVVADLMPLLFVLPCVAMMYKCMNSMNSVNRSPHTDTRQASPQNQAPASPRSEGRAAEPFIWAG
jgi:hypothetical protein